jgi:hypothetical protein
MAMAAHAEVNGIARDWEGRHIEQGASAMTRQIILFTTMILLSGCASSQPGNNGELSARDTEGQSQNAVVDMSGFSGYAWGTKIEYIESSMKDADYELIASGNKDLWYRGEILGEGLHLVYYFESGMLVSGMWIFDDVDHQSYGKVNEFLHNTYDSQTKLMIKGDDWIESELEPPGTDARIIHRLDVEADRHVVHYYFVDNLVAEEAARN